MRRSTVDKSSVYAEAGREALRYQRIESEKAGRDLGEEAGRRWVGLHWAGYLRDRWLEHLRGERYWVELDRGDFGLLQREFHDDALLLDRVLDRVRAGHDNLAIICWAIDWDIPTAPLQKILIALDINSRRLDWRFDPLDAPFVTIDPVWLAWNGGTIPGLARSISEELAFDLLPILGDALEEAGCADAAILDHCRCGGQHAGWCWVVDLILGKS